MRHSTDKTRLKRWGALVAVVLAFAMVATACGDDEASDGNVTLTLPFSESMSFFETMMGDELGYFVDEGLNLDIQTSNGGSLALQQVISGQSDFAFTSPGLVLTAAAEGNQLISLATRLQKNIFSIVVTDDSAIRTTEDLRGGVLGVSDLAGGEMPLVRAALSLAGLTVDVDVEILAVGDSGAAVLSALQDGSVDAYSADWFVFFGIEQSGTAIREIIPDELSYIPGEVLVATPQYVEDHPDVVERVLTAMAKAAYFTSYDRDAALNILRTRIPEEHEDTAVAPDILSLFLNLAAIPESGGVQTWGAQSVAAWETWKTLLGDVADTGSINVSDILDSSFIDKANDIDFDAVKKDADERNLSYP